ncbi:MAG: hypothetical protein GWO16_06300 [Gammaproteobacteria bacterium]|nr:hypothetical protein [Gammaproteobacteria bacterium]NIR97649.1 hypothetical protein [Gammaproteobacteria bacterium]NIT63310.1 hypothetical protein [Gammaproteobacteria bacterium]NIV20228.1 hypothetical protein [Gammaproteobacteria bacterium]NIX10645.1 hypothetical protein [Gammaproteobacteria bacterium]
MSSFFPTVGDWYRHETGGTFEVVALDEDEGCVEIQYFDGSVEELDLDAWEELDIQPVEPPEDWSGSLDIEPEDYGVDLETNNHLERSNPLDDLER